MSLMLRRPTPDDESEFLHAHKATTPSAPTFLHGYQEGMPFTRYLAVLDERQRGTHLPPDQVPSTFLFAFQGARIVGRVAIRHRLTDALLREGGHIGYVVVPEFRRQGHATAMLRLALDVARAQLALSRVLVTCDDDNIGSIRVIERNGGVLENVLAAPDRAKPLRRYWIETRAED